MTDNTVPYKPQKIELQPDPGEGGTNIPDCSEIWIHSQCRTCWNKINPGRLPAKIKKEFAPIETCCWCGKVHQSGIYTRVHRSGVPHGVAIPFVHWILIRTLKAATVHYVQRHYTEQQAHVLLDIVEPNKLLEAVLNEWGCRE